MRRLFAIVVCLAFAAANAQVFAAQPRSSSSSGANACSLEKCLATCNRNGGRVCSKYC